MATRHIKCVNAKGYPTRLTRDKVYTVIPDEIASEHHLVRITDDSGAEEAFTADRFEDVEEPTDAPLH